MLRRVLVLVAVGLLFAADDPKAEAIKKDQEKLKGTWKVVSGEVNGEKLASDALPDLKLVFTADKIDIKIGDLSRESTYKLDPSQKPKAMDLTNETGETSAAIYEVDGETLKICVNQAGQERPTAFATKEGTRLRVFVFQRAKS